MNDTEYALGQALKLLQDVDNVFVTDLVRINNIELGLLEQGLVYEIKEFIKSHKETLTKFHHEHFIKNQKSVTKKHKRSI